MFRVYGDGADAFGVGADPDAELLQKTGTRLPPLPGMQFYACRAKKGHSKRHGLN